MSTFTVAVADLRAAAALVAADRNDQHETLRARLNADLAAAARDKSGMADGYWKPAHAARLEALAANAALAALEEAGNECAGEGLLETGDRNSSGQHFKL